jgi:hypothetical protein
MMGRQVKGYETMERMRYSLKSLEDKVRVYTSKWAARQEKARAGCDRSEQFQLFSLLADIKQGWSCIHLICYHDLQMKGMSEKALEASENKRQVNTAVQWERETGVDFEAGFELAGAKLILLTLRLTSLVCERSQRLVFTCCHHHL